MYQPHYEGYSAPTSCSALSSLQPSPLVGPPSNFTYECIDAQTTGDKCTYTCHTPYTWRTTPQHTYDQLIRATATLLILWSQFWKWRRIKKKAVLASRIEKYYAGTTVLPEERVHKLFRDEYQLLEKKASKSSGTGHQFLEKKASKSSGTGHQCLEKKASEPSGIGAYYAGFTVLPRERVHKLFWNEHQLLKNLKKRASKSSAMGIYSTELSDAPTSTHAPHFPPMGVFLWMRSL